MGLANVDLMEIMAANTAPQFVARNNGEILFKNQLLEALCPGEAKLIADLLASESASGARLATKAEPAPAQPIKLSVIVPDGRQAIMSMRAVANTDLIVGELRPCNDQENSQAEKMEGVIQMARALGHELNQPLTVILGQAEIMLMRINNDQEIENRLNIIINEVERMEALTHKLSRIVRYETQTYADGTSYLDIDKAAE